MIDSKYRKVEKHPEQKDLKGRFAGLSHSVRSQTWSFLELTNRPFDTEQLQ